ASPTSRPRRSLVLQSALALAAIASHGGEARAGASSLTVLTRFASTASARSHAISAARSSLSIVVTPSCTAATTAAPAASAAHPRAALDVASPPGPPPASPPSPPAAPQIRRSPVARESCDPHPPPRPPQRGDRRRRHHLRRIALALAIVMRGQPQRPVPQPGGQRVPVGGQPGGEPHRHAPGSTLPHQPEHRPAVGAQLDRIVLHRDREARPFGGNALDPGHRLHRPRRQR